MDFWWQYHYDNTTQKYTYYIHTTIAQNNTTKKQTKQIKSKSAHKAAKTVKDILQPMNRVQKKKRNTSYS
jgi:hypothetical protein